jgi:hypothetical protein
MMRGHSVQYRAALASALDMWAAARERAIWELARHAATAADQGRNDDSAFFSFAARSLIVKAVHERARAAALRATA